MNELLQADHDIVAEHLREAAKAVSKAFDVVRTSPTARTMEKFRYLQKTFRDLKVLLDDKAQ